MGRHWFSPAVYIENDRAGFHAVTSVEKAVELLVDWPERGPEWEEAFRTCAEAIGDKKTADEARIAFEKAASAVNRLILAIAVRGRVARSGRTHSTGEAERAKCVVTASSDRS